MAPILSHVYPGRKTVVETDASDFALGCVLSQYQRRGLHPVAFHSRKLNSTERNYEIHDKELLAIMEAFKELKRYLWGEEEPVTVYTDHQNLQCFLTKEVWNQRQIRWAQELTNYNFKIVYCPGSRGRKPEAVSRRPEYRGEAGARHSQQSILKSEHFQISVIHQKRSAETPLIPETRKSRNLRIIKLSEKATTTTKGSRFAAGHDIYALTDGLVPAKGQTMVETGIAIRLPEGTYGRLAARSGMASKMGIAVGGGVIDADYTGQIKVILRNHGEADCLYKAGDRIAQLIIERIANADGMEVDELETTERGKSGFGSSDLNPKRWITAKEEGVKICFVHAETSENKFFSAVDIGYYPRLMKEREMLSSTHVNAALTQTMNDAFLDKIRVAGKEDERWQDRGRELVMLREGGKKMPVKGIEKDGLLYNKNRLYIPEDEALQTGIAQGCHHSLVAGHFGQEKTIEIVTRDFYWKGLAEWIRDYVRSCDECQHSKSPRHAKYGLLQPLEVSYAAWSSISTDFITQLPESQGKTQIMVVVDRFTKMAHFIGLHENATAKDVADTLLREVCKLHGLPTEIISDMDAKFSSQFWESLCKMLGVKRRMSTAYHPQTDGQTERTKEGLEGYLRTFVHYDQNDWPQLLPLAEHAYNNSATNVHKMTPFFANYGFHPQREWMKHREAHNPGVKMYAHWMQDVHRQVKQTLENTRQSMKKYCDRKGMEQPSIEVGGLVMVNAKKIGTKRPSKKLSPKLYGSFKVLEKKGSRAYKLEISPRWKIHPVFHVSLLECYRASNRPDREQPPRDPEEIEGDLEWEVERIVKIEMICYTRKFRGRNKAIKELRYFVKWKGCAEDENTWEPSEGMKNAQEEVERFHRENPEMPGPGVVE